MVFLAGCLCGKALSLSIPFMVDSERSPTSWELEIVINKYGPWQAFYSLELLW